MRCIRRSQVAGLLVARGRALPRRIPLCIFYAYLIFAVSACSFENKITTRPVAPPPPAAAEKNKLATIAAMPSAMDTFRALAPPEGLRFTPLFQEPVKDNETRLKRLEDAVQTIRNDLDTVVPTMVRMVAIEKDIKGLVAQLQTITDEAQGITPEAASVPEVVPQNLPPVTDGGQEIPGGDVVGGTEPSVVATAPGNPTASSSLVTPEAVPKGELPPEGTASPSSTAPAVLAPQAKEQPAPAAVSPKLPPPPVEKPPVAAEPKAEPKPEKKVEATGDAKTIRIADHPEKTRAVLDMTVKGNVTARIENNGKTLVIPLPDLNWLGEKLWEADTGTLISGYRIEEGNLYVDLMYPSQIKYQGILEPSGASKDHRLVIDLFSPEVHK